jgi:hypothetical protein
MVESACILMAAVCMGKPDYHRKEVRSQHRKLEGGNMPAVVLSRFPKTRARISVYHINFIQGLF